MTSLKLWKSALTPVIPMPELPDVESFRNYVDANALHKPIEGVDVHNDYVLEDVSPAQLGKQLKGHSFERTSRHGKNLFLQLDNGRFLRMHFGMTGGVSVFHDLDKEPDYTRVRFDFTDGDHLSFLDLRMFGAIQLLDDAQKYVAQQHLGPDAMTIDIETFKDRIASKRGSVKAALMDQEAIAGIGNVYSDEILFQSRLHPSTDVQQLSDEDIRKLHSSTIKVLKTAADREADPEKLPRTYLIPHRDKGGLCPRCKTELATVKAVGRTAWYCPRCQPKPQQHGRKGSTRRS